MGPCFKTGRREPFCHRLSVREIPRSPGGAATTKGNNPPRCPKALQPDTQRSVQRRVLPSTFTHPRAGYQVPGVFLDPELTLTHKARSTAHGQIKTRCHTCVEATGHHFGTRQSRHDGLVPFASLSAISGTFNSLFKVLFTFPSWYLFAIGLEPIFSLR